MQIGTTSVSGLGLMDINSMETDDQGNTVATLKFPQLHLIARYSSYVHVGNPN